VTVLDASAAVEALAVRGPLGDAVRNRLRAERAIDVPAHFLAEVYSGLRGLWLGGHIDDRAATTARRRVSAFRMRAHPFRLYTERIWELRNNATVYDAWYLAMAERLRAPLVTIDHKLADVPGVSCDVDLIQHP
jgi:predicted nucleic acid-binding protein